MFAQKAMESAPHIAEIGLAHAFLLIASDPAKAESELLRLSANGNLSRAVLQANLAMARFRQGNLAGARRAVRDLPVDSGEQLAWLWRPASLASEVPEIVEYAVVTWRVEIEVALTRTQ